MAHNYALQFDGVNDVVNTVSTDLLNTLPHTLEAWVKPDLRNDQDTNSRMFPNNIISNDNPGSGGHGFGVNTWSGGSELVVEHHNFPRVIPGVSFQAGEWYHIAVTYSEGSYVVYVDGMIVDYYSYSQQKLDGVNFIMFGYHNNDDGYGTKRYFKGIIDDIRIWNIARTKEQILADMNRELTGTEPGLVGYWNFNEGIGNTTSDLTVNKNDGAISGAEWVLSDALIEPAKTPSIIINEVMYAPVAVPGGNGEWFELFNQESISVDIAGWIIKDADYDYHIIDQQLLIPPGEFLVVGIDSNMEYNGGVKLGYEYIDTYLGNSNDEIIIVNDDNVVVDSIGWDNGITFPQANGVSIKLIDPELDNSLGISWTTSITPFGAGDCGTPGAPNYIGKLSVDDNYTFEPVKIGDTTSTIIQLSNVGADTLTIQDLIVSNYAFQVMIDSNLINPQESVTVSVKFIPIEIGEYHDSLLIVSDDYYNPMLYIQLVGEGLDSTLSLIDELIPTEFRLHQNYPNPFNPITTIQYELPQRSDVQITIYNLLGKKVATLVSETQEPGFKTIQWDASCHASGVYFYQIRVGEFVQTRKMVLLK